MKLFVLSLLAPGLVVFGGESTLTTTYQPLERLGVDKISISSVVCHDWYSHSGLPTAIGLISAPKEAIADLNLASVCGVFFQTSDIGDPGAALSLTMDVTTFKLPERSELLREDLIRACLECLRLCLPEKLVATPLTLKAAESDTEWLLPLVREFNKHDRHTVYYSPPQ